MQCSAGGALEGSVLRLEQAGRPLTGGRFFCRLGGRSAARRSRPLPCERFSGICARENAKGGLTKKGVPPKKSASYACNYETSRGLDVLPQPRGQTVRPRPQPAPAPNLRARTLGGTRACGTCATLTLDRP